MNDKALWSLKQKDGCEVTLDDSSSFIITACESRRATRADVREAPCGAAETLLTEIVHQATLYSKNWEGFFPHMARMSGILIRVEPEPMRGCRAIIATEGDNTVLDPPQVRAYHISSHIPSSSTRGSHSRQHATNYCPHRLHCTPTARVAMLRSARPR